ncbi:hypothetical protein CBR_g22931 [Chara braunii]|uniref:Uncharacterized protein n=1 Tax=Chara braunii TaxID=69332 RepID=A0A388L334_CHABU|nr:hypothetical protein CBR_g22931 [Chara braunii]|eukprot:GBG76711.1 hypothetical protein CBR_g22931 [Chara braunii]
MGSFEVWATIVASFLIEPVRTKVADLLRDYRYMKDECNKVDEALDRLGPVLKLLQGEERRVVGDSLSSTRCKGLVEDFKNCMWEDLEDCHSLLIDAERCAQSALGRWRATGKMRKAADKLSALLESATWKQLLRDRQANQAAEEQNVANSDSEVESAPPTITLRADGKLCGDDDDAADDNGNRRPLFRSDPPAHASSAAKGCAESGCGRGNGEESFPPKQQQQQQQQRGARRRRGGRGGGGGEDEVGTTEACKQSREAETTNWSEVSKESPAKIKIVDGRPHVGERLFGISKQIEMIAKELVDSDNGGKVVCILGPQLHQQTASPSPCPRGQLEAAMAETTTMSTTTATTTTTTTWTSTTMGKGSKPGADLVDDTEDSPKSGAQKDRWVREVKKWEGIDSSGGLSVESEGAATVTVGAMGAAGVGKSTVARNVVKMPAVHSYFDDGVFWLSIGQQGDILSLQRTLWRDLCKSDRVFIPFEEEDDGMHRLERKLRGKRVLLVLDDVWTYKQLELLSVVDMAAGSRILLTTRNEEVLFKKCGESLLIVHRLQLLHDDVGMQLFCWEAFGKEGAPMGDRRAKLAMSVCRMCGGLPLALKMAGRSLRNADLDKWEWTSRLLREAKRTEVRVRIFRDDVRLMAILTCMLDSLDRLDMRLRFLFLDVAAFPEHYAIPVRTVLRMWAVDPFVGSIEEAARLLWLLAERAIIRLHEGRIGGPGGDEWPAAVLHHDRAGCSCTECNELSPPPPNGSQTPRSVAAVGSSPPCTAWRASRSQSLTFSVHNAVRHLALSEIERVQSKHSRWKHVFFPGCRDQGTLLLRTFTNAVRLSLHSSHITTLPADISMPKLQVMLVSDNPIDRFPRSGFKDVTALRVLDIENCFQLRALPSCLGKLRHLKVLNLRCCSSLEALPSGIGGLRELEVLDCSHCADLRLVPDSIAKCSSLRTLHFDGCCSLRTMPLALSLLPELQILDLRNCTQLERFATQSDAGAPSSPAPAGHGMFASLVELDMTGCVDLHVFPDYGDGSFPKLKSLRFRCCVKLQCLPKSLRFCKELVALDVSHCLSLYIVPIELDYSRPDSFPNLSIINDEGLRASVRTLFARILRKNACPDAYLY